ncbi:hypothetical protein G3I34_15850 [Streptomyces sp. SID8014]|uniref:hypothetical protein n=1 Tax=Streptomyces sp. SID8014 TaxID=2706097 RepID=UPI0013B8E61E|nr:hypothetical protein [Streptomyces sp. SID8014]NEC13726.1 hypothetical protein [Streptomyces sp. SID8014]
MAASVVATPGDPASEALCTGIWALVQGLVLLLVDGALKPPQQQDIDDFIRAIIQSTLTARNAPD